MPVKVVGIGYGSDLSAAAAKAISAADVVIGHASFTDAVAHLLRPGSEAFDVLDQSTAQDDVFAVRARVASEHARRGRAVVIVSGGDPGLLGMAGPVLQAFDTAGASDVGVEVIPGLSAWQYASACLGAPFNSGLVVLSLCLYSHTEERVARQSKAAAVSGLGVVAYMLRHNGEFNPDLFPTAEPPEVIARRRFEGLFHELHEHRDPASRVYVISGLGDGPPEVHDNPVADASDLWPSVRADSVLCVPAEEAVVRDGAVWTVS